MLERLTVGLLKSYFRSGQSGQSLLIGNDKAHPLAFVVTSPPGIEETQIIA
jgi:hypothetical protein